MDDPQTGGPAARIERRQSPRVEVASLSGVVHLHLPPGREAVLLNLSRTGACIEARSRLLPGGGTELHVSTRGWDWRGRAIVTRCRVSALEPDQGARYIAALQFATPLASDGPSALLEAAREALTSGYALPEGEIGPSRRRAVTTHQRLGWSGPDQESRRIRLE